VLQLTALRYSKISILSMQIVPFNKIKAANADLKKNHLRVLITNFFVYSPSIKCRKFMQPAQHFVLLKPVLTKENVMHVA
jgi:hypothetical protein